jgi:carboxymethylenebutenolidase
MVRIKARDGHELDAYVARPTANIRGGVVVAQEMYGVNDYLRSVCDFYAAHGYVAIAPALYDRQRQGLVFGYDKEDHDRAQRMYKSWDWDSALDDLDAGRDTLTDAGKVGLVGFCWGGSLAWLAACRRSYACTAAYYGGNMPDFVEEHARCPVIAHIGDKDATLPAAKIRSFRAVQPSVPVYIYPGAPHGFDNENRTSRYHPAACRLARAHAPSNFLPITSDRSAPGARRQLLQSRRAFGRMPDRVGACGLKIGRVGAWMKRACVLTWAAWSGTERSARCCRLRRGRRCGSTFHLGRVGPPLSTASPFSRMRSSLARVADLRAPRKEGEGRAGKRTRYRLGFWT